MKHVAIIGNGISGVTLARHLRKGDPNLRISLISAETPYFFSRTALMYVYMGHMTFEHTKPYEDHFWEKNRIELIQDYVNKVNTREKWIGFSSGKQLNYDKLVLATGSKPNKFGWPGQDLNGVQGLYSYLDLLQLEENTHPVGTAYSKQRVKRAVIVGGGLIGVELAEMLMSRNIAVSFLVREARFWGNVLPNEEGELVARLMKEHGVDLRLNAELDEILADELGQVKAVRTKSGEEIPCQFVGLTAGVSPNIDFLRESGIELNRGILVDPYLRSSEKDVYALGDCAEFRTPPPGRRSIEQVWYTGRMMGETLAQTLLGKETAYSPGPWFNSAKFFDIEYQTYGTVNPQLQEDERSFYWEHPSGKQCLKMVFKKENRELVGINVFGIRLRHELLDRWLREKRSAEYFLTHFKDASFDPEFFPSYAAAICAKFNQELGMSVQPAAFSWKRILGKVN